jgi:hypothetical protein
MSHTLFDPGDLDDISQIYQDQLSAQELYGHIINIKSQEILAPNLPMAWQIHAVDGYDGGVLPLARYVDLQRLLIPEEHILSDGRLREGLSGIPTSRLLSLLGAEYVVTDKVHDVWIDRVFYDLAFESLLAAPSPESEQTSGAVPSLSVSPPLPYLATKLGIVSHLQGAQAVPQGMPVAKVLLTMRSEDTLVSSEYLLRAGYDTAQGAYADPGHKQARIAQSWRQDSEASSPSGYDYVTELSWDSPQQVLTVDVQALPFGGMLSIRGLALVDDRDGSSQPLLPSIHGRFVQVHSGDVKIYQALDVLPRVYVVHQARVATDDGLAITAMRDPTFNPGQTVILHSEPQMDDPLLPTHTSVGSATESAVTVLSYEPHEIVLRARLEKPGYVVLSDSWYPGWRASLDGQAAHIYRANLAFRAVRVPQGTHLLSMTYRPPSYLWGLRVSLGSLICAVALALFLVWRQHRTRRALKSAV